MKTLRVRPAVLLLVACAGYPVRPPLPPADPKQRQREEIDACEASRLPRWLEDDAMEKAVALDRREAQASATNEAFRGAMYTSQPPASPRGEGPRAAALFGDRRAFEGWCAGFKARLAPPPR